MEKRQSLKQLLEHQRVFAPCIWDCMSAKAAEMSGFPATLLSSGCMSFSMRGLPDMGLLTLDEVLMMTERITNVSSLPLIVDAEDGYGDSPVHALSLIHISLRVHTTLLVIWRPTVIAA